MKYLKIKNTDLEVSRIALGCMTLGGEWNDSPPSNDTINYALKVIRTALDEGINFFDHADIYTRGKSEIVFSHVWDNIPSIRDKIFLQSKCGIRFPDVPYIGAPQRFDFSYEHIIYSVENILSRLKTDYIDILLLHRPDPLVEPEEVAKAFDELKISGKVRYFGVSNHTPYQIDLLKKFLTQPIVVNQLEYSLVHTEMLEEGIAANQKNPVRAVRGLGIIEYCRINDILIQSWSPLAKGLLTGKLDRENEKMAAASDVLKQIAEQKNVSAEAILIAWILRHPAGIQPISGTINIDRIKALCRGVDVQLSRDEWYKLFIAGRSAPLP